MKWSENASQSLYKAGMDCYTVRKVALAGGYAHLLCSTIQATEQVSTIRDGLSLSSGNEYSQYNLLPSHEFPISSSLWPERAAQRSVDSIRFEDYDEEFPIHTAAALARLLSFGTK